MSKRGIVFIIVLVFILILVIAAGTFILLSSSEIKMARGQNDSTRAFYIAEAGIEKGARWLKAQLEPPSSPYSDSGSLTAAKFTGTYTYTVSPHADNPSYPPPSLGTYEYNYTITSTGTVSNVTRTIETEETIEIKETTFAVYSYFTSYESYLIWWWWWQFEVPVWFTTGTFLEGPVHTNDQFHISGDPIFDGPVSSVATTIDYMHGGPPNDNPDFRQGITLGASPIDTTPLAVDNLKNAAASTDGYEFTGNTTVLLRSDGTVDVTNRSLTPRTQNMSLPGNGALFVRDGDLYISGTVNGSLTAGASRDIVIMDDIRYNTDPRATPASTDKLGLIAERDVAIDSHASDGNPGKNLEVFASMIAIGQEPAYGDDNGSFYVENYSSGLKGVLTVYGGIIQKRRGPVGTFYSSNNQKRSGYDKDYHYDPRMDTNPPPHFPLTTMQSYQRISWKESKE